jgi:hypothetical protein
LRKRLVVLGAVFLVGIVGFGVWWKFLRTPTPDEVAMTLRHKVFAADPDWLYDRASEKERAVISRELLREFYATFVEPELRKCKVEAALIVDRQATRSVALSNVVNRDGKAVQLTVGGYVVDGRATVGAFQTLENAYTLIKYAGLEPKEMARRGWADIAPWLLERGVTQWYFIAVDTLYPVPGAAEHKAKQGGDPGPQQRDAHAL